MLPLSLSELREVACAHPVLPVYGRDRPDDRRPHAAVEAARVFAGGGRRVKALRDTPGPPIPSRTEPAARRAFAR